MGFWFGFAIKIKQQYSSTHQFKSLLVGISTNTDNRDFIKLQILHFIQNYVSSKSDKMYYLPMKNTFLYHIHLLI